MVVRINEVRQIEAHEYTDRQGQQQVFKSKGFIMQTSEGSIYAEAFGDLAEGLDRLEIKSGDCALVQLSCNARTYTTKDGVSRVTNEFTITKMTLL